MAPVWDRFVKHPFVMAMGNGSLPLESFKGYLVQDYLYLVGLACLARPRTQVSGWLTWCVDTLCSSQRPGGLQSQEHGRYFSCASETPLRAPFALELIALPGRGDSPSH